jgi:alpha-tubulin suppressor-like RCC1 family protein
LVLTEIGKIYVFGDGKNGKLGIGDSDTRFYPTLLPLEQQISYIAAGSNHSAAITCINV